MRKRARPKRLVLGVTGSIACYKAAELARYFMKRGYSVRTVMTESASRFVSPLTFQALTGNPVTDSFWSESAPGNIGHIELADWAEAVVIAPATADCIAKLAMGCADSSLLAVVLATKAPVVVAPAMNVNMLEHPQTQENMRVLRRRGVAIVEPESGALACGWTGSGRLASPQEIFSQTERALGPGDLSGRSVLITAGPTREAIDPVRFLSNRSSGKMGVALAREAYRRGAAVTLVHGPLSYKPDLPHEIRRCAVITADEMFRVVMEEVYGKTSTSKVDVALLAAAVADFRPAEYSSSKLKKSAGMPVLDFVANADILGELGARRSVDQRPFLVGFAVETEGEAALLAEAKAKLVRKGADVVVGNLAQDAFEGNTNRVWIVHASGDVVPLTTAGKRSIARGIWGTIAGALPCSS